MKMFHIERINQANNETNANVEEEGVECVEGNTSIELSTRNPLSMQHDLNLGTGMSMASLQIDTSTSEVDVVDVESPLPK